MWKRTRGVIPHLDPFDKSAIRSWNRNAHAVLGQDDDEEEEPIVDMARAVDGILLDGDDDLVSPAFALFYPIEEPATPCSNRILGNRCRNLMVGMLSERRGAGHVD